MGKDTVKKHKALKVILIVLSVMVLLCVGGFFIAATHTQIVVSFLQKIADNGKPLNSYEPLNEPQNGLKENGQYLISEIEYAKDYPNSFLDIIYPDENRDADRPTLFYCHGGGFFAGSKNMGDPLAANEATALLCSRIQYRQCGLRSCTRRAFSRSADTSESGVFIYYGA